MKLKHLTSITDLSSQEIVKIIKKAIALKKELKSKGKNKNLLENKTLAMIFEKPSLRTRISFEIGMTQLGGHAIYLGPSDIQMGTRESIEDIAKVTSSMTDIIMARTFAHGSVIKLAKNSTVPVINGLSDLEHPCQILADLMTIYEVKKTFKNLTISFVGDCENNVTHSLALASSLLNINFRCAAPKEYFMDKKISKLIKAFETEDPYRAVKDSDVVITDTWISMGDEKEKQQRLKIFKKYQVNKKLMDCAKKDAIFLHCLPAYRGNEVTSEVIDGKQSVVFQEAENRLHAQKALILFLLGL
jgi:ornithine carbamoyltransferase